MGIYNSYCKQPSLFARIVMVLLLLSPILQCYGWGKFDFSFIVISFLALCHLLNHGIRNTKVPHTLIFYFGWWYLSHILSSSSLVEFLPLGILRIIITYIMFIDLFDLDYFISKYKKIAGFVIIYFYIQELGRVLGVHIPSVFPFLPIAVMEDGQEYIQLTMEWSRSASLFKKPAVFAQYLLPLLILELFYNKKKNWMLISILVLTLLCSKTGNGMVGLLALFICYIINIIKKQKGIKLVSSLVMGFLLSVLLLTVYFKTDAGIEMNERISTVGVEDTVDKGYASSTFMRIYQGFFIFSEYSNLYKIIGNDHDSYIQSCAYNSPVISALYGKNDMVTYFNAFQNVLIYTGYIGIFIIFLFFRYLWKGNTLCGKSLLFTLIVLSMVASVYFTNTMALYLLPAIALKNKCLFNNT